MDLAGAQGNSDERGGGVDACYFEHEYGNYDTKFKVLDQLK